MSDARASNVDPYKREVESQSGRVGYLDTGGDLPVALFVHGVATSSSLWRHAITQLVDRRRCIAVDLPLHGRTPAAPDQDFSFNALATFLADFCDALSLTQFDLIANDTGGAIAQVFAVRETRRLRSFVLTNCDTQGNLPPRAFLPTMWLARSGLLAIIGRQLLRSIPLARRRLFSSTYQNVQSVPVDLVREWLQPVFGSRQHARQFQRWVAGLNDRELVAIEPKLRGLRVPTLLVWGTGDRFFSQRWAHWLHETIPGATDIIEIPGGKLFFPDERADEFVAAISEFWESLAREVPQADEQTASVTLRSSRS